MVQIKIKVALMALLGRASFLTKPSLQQHRSIEDSCLVVTICEALADKASVLAAAAISRDGLSAAGFKQAHCCVCIWIEAAAVARWPSTR